MRFRALLFAVAMPFLVTTVLFLSLQQAAASPSQLTSTEFKLVNQIGGVVRAVAHQGDYAFVGVGPKLIILDTTDPNNPAPVHQSEVLPYYLRELRISGNYLWGLLEDEVAVFDISNPETTTLLNTISVNGRTSDLVISDTLAYVSTETSSGFENHYALNILDITDPMNITIISQFGQHDSIKAIAIKGNYAYLSYLDNVGGGYHLRIANISNPSSPLEANSFPNIDFARDVQIYADQLLLIQCDCGGSYDAKFNVYDLNNPEFPTYKSGLSLKQDISEMYLHNKLVYIVDRSEDLVTIDLSEILTPTVTNGYETDGLIWDGVVEDSKLYLATDFDGLHVVDISLTPTLVSRYEPLVQIDSVDIFNDKLYLVNNFEGIHVFNLVTPTNPLEIGYKEWPALLLDVIATNNALYALGPSTLMVFDITNSVTPTWKLNLNLSDFSYNREIVKYKNFLYITSDSGPKELYVFDISNPLTPTLVAEKDFGSTSIDLAISDDYAYLVGYSSIGLIDISNPLTPSVTSIYTPTISTFSLYNHHIAAQNDLLYIVNSHFLEIVDVSDKMNPQLLHVFEIADYVLGDIELLPHELNIVGWSEWKKGNPSIFSMNLTDPQTPTLKASINAYLFALELTTYQNYIYGAAKDQGLFVLKGSVIPEVNLQDLKINETTAVFTVTLSEPTTSVVAVDYTLAMSGTGSSNITDTITFTAGITSQVTMTSIPAAFKENGFTLTLSNPVNAQLGDTISATFAAQPVILPEVNLVSSQQDGTLLTFTSTLSAVSSMTTTVDYTVAVSGTGRTATAALTGTITFAPEEVTQTTAVSLTNEMLANGYTISLSNPNNATLGTHTTLTIPPTKVTYFSFLPLLVIP